MSTPYGAWPSPLSSLTVATAGRKIADLVIDDGAIVWSETRPEEGGRVTILRREADGTVRELLPAPFNARTRVHEYGGGAIAVHAGTVYFSNFGDQRIYLIHPRGLPVAVTSEGKRRYADAVIDSQRQRLIAVCEDHTQSDAEPQNAIVAVEVATGKTTVVAAGHDFYSNPRLSPRGDRLCWLAWDHPNMPWNGTTLYLADVAADGSVSAPKAVAGGPNESIYGPQWSPAGVLHFVSDRTGWWNLYRLNHDKVDALWPLAAEFGLPHWVFGGSTFGFHGEDVICLHGRPGAWRLSRISQNDAAPFTYELPFTELANVRVGGGRAFLVAASPASMPVLASLELETGEVQLMRAPNSLAIDPNFVSKPEAVAFATPRGEAHAFYYPPHNPDHGADPDERPPLIVISHGGPTASTSTALNLQIQYWTTRGFAVVDVNYGGSSGYGRSYRDRLEGNWGIVDVEDCIAAVNHLVARGLADGNRLIIRGGSAGGYTTLCALAFHRVFRAGASHYGVADLEALARDTHKFEAHYLDRLIGPLPAARAMYVERSPIHHVDGLSCPIIFLQGSEDRIVPPAQAETMVAALRAKGLPVAYIVFAGEQHGFRRAENIHTALEAELYFYGRTLDFKPADRLATIVIENLPRR